MKEENVNSNDERLSALLRSTRPAPALRPRFQEGVWRRVEESDVATPPRVGWLDLLVSRVVRPKFALAAAVVLVAAGSVVGAREGNQAAQHDAQSRYIASVAPNSLR